MRKDREMGDVKQAIADAKAEKLKLMKDFEDTKSRTAGLQAALASARGKLSDAIDVSLLVSKLKNKIFKARCGSDAATDSPNSGRTKIRRITFQTNRFIEINIRKFYSFSAY